MAQKSITLNEKQAQRLHDLETQLIYITQTKDYLMSFILDGHSITNGPEVRIALKDNVLTVEYPEKNEP